jgi:autotransporter passenger strand-loop-strand repeat protein
MSGTADQPIVIPIYRDPLSTYLEIYASLGGGTAEPYSFDTGAPNLFATYGSWWGGTSAVTQPGTASFTFAQAPTYQYNSLATSVTLSDAAGASLATADDVNVAQITDIFTAGLGTPVQTPTQAYANWSTATETLPATTPLSDGTFGDFGAGLYGSSTLGTVLAQLPEGPGLSQGYIVEAPGFDAAPGTLTVGLSAATISAWESQPGVITLQMSGTGGTLPNPDGNPVWSAYPKAQAADTVVTVTSGGVSTSFDIPTVLDTDGGPNNNIYNDGSLAPVSGSFPAWLAPLVSGAGYLPEGTTYTLVQSGSADPVLSYTVSGRLPAGGVTEFGPTTVADGTRDNPGANLFLSDNVMFDVADGIILLQPISETDVASGGSVTGGAALTAGDRLHVAFGGTATGQSLDSGAFASVSGIISDTVVAGGYAVVSTTGNARDSLVTSGGSLILSGGAASGTTLSAGGVEILAASGHAAATQVSGGGRQLVSSGGATDGTTIASGGLQQVAAGGVASGTVIEAGAYALVSSGGSAIGTVLGSGGALVLLPGAVATAPVQSGGSTLSSGLVLEVSGSGVSQLTPPESGALIGTGDTLYVLPGGAVAGVALSGGVALDWGTESGTTILANGTGIVYGSSTDAEVSAGYQVVTGGGTATLTTIGAAGVEYVRDGGVALSTILDSAARTIVYSGGLVTGAAVGAGGADVVLAGGSASGVTISGGGVEVVSSGGSASVTVIDSGGVEQVAFGGVASGATVGGFQLVAGGGTAVSSVVQSGGFGFISGGGQALGTVLESGGYLVLVAGGTASGTVSSGGSVIATGVAVDALGTAITLSGTDVSGMSLGFGSAGYVLHGARVTDTVIGGGTGYVWGNAVSTLVSANGAEVVHGRAAGTILSGGDQFVASGGVASGTVIATSGLMILESGGTAAGGILFDGAGAALTISAGLMLATPISGFAASDGIALASFSDSGAKTASLSGDTLTLSNGGHSFTLSFSGLDAGTTFDVSAFDGGSGTLLTLACFAAGTRIMTPDGAVAVEALREGDLVTTVAGVALPVAWHGHRSVECRRHPRPAAVQPVRIAAHTFGAGRPARPLLLSPDHAVFAADVLIPVKHLINGTSIRQLDLEKVTYHHIELPCHSVIWAEGLPTESYLDTGDRASFAGAAMALQPAWGSEARDVTVIFDALGYAPLCVTGPEVDAVRAAISTGPSVRPARMRRQV